MHGVQDMGISLQELPFSPEHGPSLSSEMSSILDFLNDCWLLPCPLLFSHMLFVPPHPQLDPCCPPSWVLKTQGLEKQAGAADGLSPPSRLTPALSNPLPKPQGWQAELEPPQGCGDWGASGLWRACVIFALTSITEP